MRILDGDNIMRIAHSNNNSNINIIVSESVSFEESSFQLFNRVCQSGPYLRGARAHIVVSSAGRREMGIFVDRRT